jgi:hypothetical protein
MRDLKVRLKKFKKTHCHLTIELFGDYCLCAPSHPMGGAAFDVTAVAVELTGDVCCERVL